MLSKLQRTRIESKSQLDDQLMAPLVSCYQNYKEQELKANHNPRTWRVVYTMLLSKLQRTRIESKSQQSHKYHLLMWSCYQNYKEQELKANHNVRSCVINRKFVVIKTTKNKN